MNNKIIDRNKKRNDALSFSDSHHVHTHTILLDIFFFFEAEKTEVVHDPFVSPIDPEADLWIHLTGFRELDEVFAFLTRDRRDKDRLGKRRHG